jgi:hypothetical protein
MPDPETYARQTAEILAAPAPERAPRDWLLVEVSGWDGTHVAGLTAKMPMCGRKGVMMPVGKGDPSCPDCARILANGSHDDLI